MMPLPTRNRLLPAALAMTLALAACGDDAEETSAEDSGSSVRVVEVAEGITATGPWARSTPAEAENGAAYFTLSSVGDLVIMTASAPAEIAGAVELHETVPAHDTEATDDTQATDGEAAEDDSAAESGGDGMDTAMTMRQVDSIVVPAGGSVVLEPGGLHVMLLDLAEPLEAGDTFDLTLTTETGDELTVPIEVRDEAP